MKKMPALFVGHGSPMNLVSENAYTRSLADLGPALPRPEAILVISAHWTTRGRTLICCAAKPRQIYDFYGFPEELYRIRYEPPGHPALAARAATLLGGDAAGVFLDDAWGDDHAGWAVLSHLYPKADIPLVLLSVDMAAPPTHHLALAKRLAPLREEGVLLLGSGNIVHNLYEIDYDMDTPPDPRGVAFDAGVKEALDRGDAEALADLERFGPAARYAAPTLDHYLPLLWAAAHIEGATEVAYPCDIFQNKSVSMRSVKIEG